MSQSKTHPVYIQQSLKNDVNRESVEMETPMKAIAERLIVRGLEKGFHEDPLPADKMTKGSDETDPVYVNKDLKDDLKKRSVDMDTTMRRLTERLITRGLEKNLHEEELED